MEETLSEDKTFIETSVLDWKFRKDENGWITIYVDEVNVLTMSPDKWRRVVGIMSHEVPQ